MTFYVKTACNKHREDYTTVLFNDTVMFFDVHFLAFLIFLNKILHFDCNTINKLFHFESVILAQRL